MLYAEIASATSQKVDVATSPTPCCEKQSPELTVNTEVPETIEADLAMYGFRYDEDPQDPEDSSYHYCTRRMQFMELCSLMHESLHSHKPDKSDAHPLRMWMTRLDFNSRMREVFDHIREKAKKDETIPDAMFDPPRSFIRFVISHWPIDGHYCCPCDIPEWELPKIEVRVVEGVVHGITKDFVLERLCDDFYGTKEDPGSYKIGGTDDRPVIDGTHWMGPAEHPMGDLYLLCRGFKSTLWSYGPGPYEDDDAVSRDDDSAPQDYDMIKARAREKRHKQKKDKLKRVTRQ